LDADEWYAENTQIALSRLLPALPDRYGSVSIHRITVIGGDEFTDSPMTMEDLDQYYPGYPQLEDKHLKDFSWYHNNGSNIHPAYQTRVVNKSRGQFVNKVHETFEHIPGCMPYILPDNYLVHHQKSWEKQHNSHAVYNKIQNLIEKNNYD
jgi:hypothetical protein